jgi:DNA-3-methyladenine glycosylase
LRGGAVTGRSTRLTKSFYARDALAVARDLIGCLFFSDGDEGRTGVRIVETEAYRGALDPGSHGYRGPTPRNHTMFGPAGRLYVYFTYGMHWCANVVCGPEGLSEAVLLRAGEPVAGVEVMRSRRGGVADDQLLATGPARLAQAMGITRADDGATLLRGGRFWFVRDAATEVFHGQEIARTRRIGLAPGRGDDLEWRFVVAGHRHASRRR